MVADTGSTNGTFVGGVRIAYGKAIVLNDSDKLRFGTVEVELQRVVKGNVEEQFTAKLSSGENFVTNTNFSAAENVRIKNEFATKNDFSTNQNFATNEIAASEEILPEKVSSLKTAEDFKTKNDFAKEKTSSSDEKEIAADSEEKTPVEITKDEL